MLNKKTALNTEGLLNNPRLLISSLFIVWCCFALLCFGTGLDVNKYFKVLPAVASWLKCSQLYT